MLIFHYLPCMYDTYTYLHCNHVQWINHDKPTDWTNCIQHTRKLVTSCTNRIENTTSTIKRTSVFGTVQPSLNPRAPKLKMLLH